MGYLRCAHQLHLAHLYRLINLVIMSHNTLIEKIEADVKAAVAEVEAKQAAAVSAIERETDAKVDALKTAQRAQLEKTLSHKELVAVSRAKQAANIAIQQAKRDEINAVIDEVKDAMAKLDSAAYVEFYAAQLKAAVGDADVDATKVVTAPGRTEEAEKILKAVHAKAEVTEDKAISAGLIMHTKDGVYDVTLDRLFAEKRAAMEMDVTKTLTS